MKTLLLLRHAKSSWKDSELDDHDRPRNKRGKCDAPRMGELIKELQLAPDFLVCSSARRARKTAEHVIHASGYRGESRITSELYHADRQKLVAFVANLPDAAARVLLIGHNPDLEELLEALTGQCAALSTAALAQIELAIDSWRDLPQHLPGKLVKIWQPRELD